MEKPAVKYGLEVSHGTSYGIEEAAALLECLRENAPSCGKKVKQFEEEFARYCGANYALAVTSATAGLYLAGIAAGIKPGDEVITTPISWIATSAAFATIGATVVFADVDPLTLDIDPDKIKEKISERTRAIVPVHLYGRCCDMDRILEIADENNLTVIEDCAHNPGGEYKGKKSGSLGHMGVFSFHQQKNMSTLGEGGMVTTSDRKLYEKVLSYRSLCCRIYGESHKYLSIDENAFPMDKKYWWLYFDDTGYNFRMTDAQAAVGIEQLKKLDENNRKRRVLARALTGKLEDIKGLQLPLDDPDGKHTFHLYVIQLEDDFPVNKTDFMWELYTAKGIKAWSHYMPIHLTGPFKKLGHGEGECPVAEKAFKKYVTLPVHPGLSMEAIDYMAECVKEVGSR
jgi:perosamine synthetase